MLGFKKKSLKCFVKIVLERLMVTRQYLVGPLPIKLIDVLFFVPFHAPFPLFPKENKVFFSVVFIEFLRF